MRAYNLLANGQEICYNTVISGVIGAPRQYQALQARLAAPIVILFYSFIYYLFIFLFIYLSYNYHINVIFI